MDSNPAPNSARQVELLEEIHEVLVYILECLLQQCYGNSKTEFLALKRDLAEMTELHQGYRDAISGVITRIEEDFFGRDRNKAAWEIVRLRHQVRNTVCTLTRTRPWYRDAEVL